MAELLRMPEVAAAMTEAVLAAWPVAEGTTFAKGDPVVVVETDKAEVEVPAHVDGVLLRTLVPAGAEVEVGSPIALLGAPGEVVADIDALLAELGVASQAPDNARIAVRRDVPEAPAAEAPTPTSAPTTPPVVPDRGGRIFSSPLARKMAREAGLALDTLTGTGPGGRIVRADITTALAVRANTPEAVPDAQPQPTAAASAASSFTAVVAAPAPATPVGYEDIPHTRMRRAIAARLLESKQTAPHFYLRASCRVDALLDLRARLNASGAGKVSVNDLLVKAVGRAHTLVPEMNAVWTPDAVRRFTAVDVSVAIATDNGLVTPVLRGVEALSVSAIAEQVRGYAEKARTGGLQQDDLVGGTITVTNLGMFGVEEFAAIINPPQAAILAVGAARDEPVVVDGVLEAAKVLRLTLSVDHRPIDGALAARWMGALTQVVENPLQILL
ncbi:dihydrolipoamide acetyltransferase family protein [Streptomyces sp. NPDC055692]|uniref:dihydrolipoamide acetyltransferase family protein n=1 Tax=Streptomyces sp. NPDC055692 TaxID=3155683 RepID=UPI00343C73D8